MKAILPLIATLLLLIITISVVGLVFVWFSRVGPEMFGYNDSQIVNTEETTTPPEPKLECARWEPVYAEGGYLRDDRVVSEHSYAEDACYPWMDYLEDFFILKVMNAYRKDDPAVHPNPGEQVVFLEKTKYGYYVHVLPGWCVDMRRILTATEHQEDIEYSWDTTELLYYNCAEWKGVFGE